MCLSRTRLVITIGVLGAGALLAGCQSTKGAAPAAAAKAPAAQTASCPKCRMVTESNEFAAGSHRTPAVTVMRCDDCTNAVTNLLAKGEFKHDCVACGDKVDQMCMQH